MKHLTALLLLIFAQAAFSQASTPNDTFKIGQSSSASDKGFIFDTADGGTNKKLVIEKISKLLKFDGNSFQVGDGALTQDKALIFNGTSGKKLSYDHTNTEFNLNDDVKVSTGVMKLGNSTVKEVASKLYFSENGGPDKRLGSGSGGGDTGISVISNGSFEDGISTGWSNTGGTSSQGTYTNATDSDSKYYQLVASGSGQYFESTAVAVPDFVTGGCLAKIDYSSTDVSGTWKLQIYDGSANLLKEVSLDPKDWKPGYAGFICPVIGTTVKLRVISTASGTIKADHAYIGSENRTFQVSQAQLAGESNFPPQASCGGWTRTSTTLGPVATDADCLGPVIAYSSLGSWQTIDSDLPIQIINNLPAGTYKAKFMGIAVMGTANTPAFAINDGSTTCSPVSGSSLSTNQGQFTIECTFVYTSSGNRSFQLYFATNSGSLSILNSVTSPAPGLKFILEYFPNSSQTALVPEAQDWFVNVNIGGASATTSLTNQASYTEIVNGSLDLVLQAGSAPARIPCSGTNPAGSGTPSVCSVGTESIGVVFTPPSAGQYEVCGSFTHGMVASGASSSTFNTFQFMETTPSTQTIIQEGIKKTGSGMQTNQAGSASSSYPHYNCGIFKFDSVTEKTIRLMFEAQVVGTVTQSYVMGDRGAAYGQPEINIFVRPLLSAYGRPYLTGDQLTTPGANNIKDYAQSITCKVAGSGGGVAGDALSGQAKMFTSVGNMNAGTGVCIGTFNNTLFNNPVTTSKPYGEPYCWVTGQENGNSAYNLAFRWDSATQVSLYCLAGAGQCGTGAKFDVFCRGVK